MKSAPECFHHAAKCERLARDSLSNDTRKSLLALASSWRVLGEQAKAKAMHEFQEPWPFETKP